MTDPKCDSINADLAIKQKVRSQTVTWKLFTSGSATVEFKLDNLSVDGLNATVLAGIGETIGVGTLEYCRGRVGLTSAVDYYGGPSVLSTAAVAISSASMPGFCVVGAESEYNAKDKNVTRANSAISYFDGKESELTLHILDKGKKAMLSYSHLVRPAFSVAAQMTHDRETNKSVLTMGTGYRLDGMTTVKGKLDSNGSLALTYMQTVRPKTTLTMSTSFDVNKLNSAKMGLSLAFE